jgi:alkanesulfonate monooxygenase SsuD/methylene tetrahydromethanopterin reductase-like flavin-dependent oxidoreductase (luciferase family)
VAIALGLDPDQGLSQADELRLVKLAAELGYESAWTNSGADTAAFERCIRWHQASGLPTGISAVPASGQPAAFYAEHARRAWDATSGGFTLVVGSGQWDKAGERMRRYLPEVREALMPGMPLYAAALGPLMLEVGAQLADGIALNWCTAEQVTWSRQRVEAAARRAGRSTPRVIEYIRTAVDPDPTPAQRTVATAAARYLGFPVYRRHFERMGVAAELEQGTASGATPPPDIVRKIGAAGKPGETRSRFVHLATGLDLPIVRILVTQRGDFESARRALEECKPSA